MAQTIAMAVHGRVRMVLPMRLMITAIAVWGCSHSDAPGAGRPDASAAAPVLNRVTVIQLQGTSFAGTDASFPSRPSSTELGTVGACTAVETPTGASTPELSAGLITVTTDQAMVTLVPSSSPPVYPEYPLPRPPYSPGASVSASATGSSAVAAFALDAPAPSDIEGYLPPSAIRRSAGYTATWIAGSGEHMLLTITVVRGGTGDALQCDVPDTGSYAVPPLALAYLGNADGSTLATVRLARSNTATDSAGGVELQVVTAIAAQAAVVP